MPDKMRARHEVFGVNDVPDNDFYRSNGWVKVADDTPTAAEERRAAVNAMRRGDYDPAEHKAADVVAALAAAPEDEAAEVLKAEKSGKARKSVLDAD